jgi:nucleotide-binding universal stress UspA family protein
MTAFQNVLTAIDLSGTEERVERDGLSSASAAAFGTAARVAAADGAHLHILSALDLDAFGAAALEREEAAGRPTIRPAAAARLAELATLARARGVANVTTAVPTGAPADSAIEDIRAARRDLVVCGTRERGPLARALLGSTSVRLVRRSPSAVWIARSEFGAKPPVILCAVEIGSLAAPVLQTAARLASKTGGTVHVVHVVDLKAEDVLRSGAADREFIEGHRRDRRVRAEREIPALVAANAPSAAARVSLVEGDANEAILAQAAAVGAGLLVLGSVAHGVASVSPFLGRTAEHVVVNAPCSVLVLKP